ncbi:LRFN5 [Mytilus edulis]|uniref:LRFN5 n=1 Tax=Mytilus edulis TaxID=6550 RepID=A0A8S3UEX7_MYTED|nr:LRFN5 [Mytilus edulis]
MNYAFKCSSNSNCVCINTPLGLIADCSGLGLTTVPWFTNSVVSVNLSKNSLTQLPPQGRLSLKLKYLDLSVNMIRNFSTDGTLPFSNTKHILSLNLSYNRILLDRDTYVDGIFKNLQKLQHLDVSYNSFGDRKYYCPDEVFKELQSLKRLHIDAVLNVSFGKGFLALRQLTHLKLTGLTSRITIPKNYFLYLPNLIFLDLSAQWDKQFSYFTGLEHIESGTFRRLVHLEILDISYNRKLGLCGFTNVTHDLPFTSIKVFKAKYLACERGGSTLLFNNDIKPLLNTKLEELYIDGNNLDKAEQEITSFFPKSLHYISAKDNRWIAGPYSYYHMLINLTNVKKIDLSFQNRHQMSQSVNSWKCDYDNSVVAIGCLCQRYPHKINMHHLTFEPEIPYNQKAKLIKANHSATIHSCVPYFYPFFELVIVPPNIEEIIMERARVGYSIPPLYISSPSVRKILLRNNQLYSFIGPMCNFTNLQFLDLSGNKATDISSYVFGALPSLRHLALDNNILGNSKIFFTVDSKHIFENQTNLTFLNISSNSLSILFQDLLLRSTDLKHIYLDHNLLVDWNVTIEHMKNLEILDISWNQILYLSPNGMQRLEKSFSTNVSINMMNNPLHCSCDSLNFFLNGYKNIENIFYISKITHAVIKAIFMQ